MAEQISATIPKVLVTGGLEVTCGAGIRRVFYKPVDWDEMERFVKKFARVPAAG